MLAFESLVFEDVLDPLVESALPVSDFEDDLDAPPEVLVCVNDDWVVCLDDEFAEGLSFTPHAAVTVSVVTKIRLFITYFTVEHLPVQVAFTISITLFIRVSVIVEQHLSSLETLNRFISFKRFIGFINKNMGCAIKRTHQTS